jgi:predicted lipid-binding transport protein (Tim44 family)
MRLSTALAGLSMVAVLVPVAADAQPYGPPPPPPPPPHHYYHHHHYHHRYRESCAQARHDRAVTGTVAGAAGGAILGGAIGGHLGGALLGAGAGALAGHAIAKNTGPCS